MAGKKLREAGPRILIDEVNYYGWFVRKYHIAEDDSFILAWCLPSVGHQGAGDKGERVYINPDEMNYSYKHCARILDSLNPSR